MKSFVLLLCCLLLNSFAVAKSKEIEIKVLKDLSFGIIKAGRVAGTITVTPDSPPMVTTTGGVFAVSGEARKPTRLKLKGQKNTLVYLNLQNRTLLYSEQGATLNLDLQINSSLRNMGPSGVLTDIFIGGTLNVEPNPSAGVYQGDFTITVDYQ